MITVFASRKISLLSMISDIDFQMNLLNQKRMNLATVGMNIADNQITSDELQQGNYYVQNGLSGVIGFGNLLSQQNAQMGQPIAMVQQNMFNGSFTLHTKTVELATAQLAAQEKALDIQIKQLETKLNMYTKDYEKCEEAEKKSIERATPKYGVA